MEATLVVATHRRRKLVIRQPISLRLRLTTTLISLTIFVLVYELIAYQAHLKNPTTTTMPYIQDIVAGFLKIIQPDRYGDIWLLNDVWATVVRLTVGMFVSCAAAIALGIMMGCFEWIEAIIKPYPSTASVIPATAMMAVFFLLVGTDFPFYVSIIAFGTVPVLSLSIYSMTKYDVPSELIDKAYTLGASNAEVVWEVVVPMLRPRILDMIRLMFGPAMLVLIAGEYQLADVGVGYRMRMQMRSLDMAVIYDYVIVLCLIGFLNNYMMVQLRKWWCPWYSDY